MNIVLLAEYFPQVAACATIPSESLHQWSGPEKEKILSGQKIEEYPVIESFQNQENQNLLSETQRVRCQWVFAERLGILCNAIDETQSIRQLEVLMLRHALYSRWTSYIPF